MRSEPDFDISSYFNINGERIQDAIKRIIRTTLHNISLISGDRGEQAAVLADGGCSGDGGAAGPLEGVGPERAQGGDGLTA